MIVRAERLTGSRDRFNRFVCQCGVVHEVRVSDVVVDDDPFGPAVHPGVREVDCSCGDRLRLTGLEATGSTWEVVNPDRRGRRADPREVRKEEAMPRFTVIRTYIVSVSEQVEAVDVDGAMYEDGDWPSLCHECSGRMQIDDTVPSSVIVLDEAGNVVGNRRTR